MKVMTIVGTRPELIRLSAVIPSLEENLEHVLVHTGQNYDYELNGIFFRDLGLSEPDHFLNAAGETPSETIGQVIIGVDRVIRVERPDTVLILGDTNSCMAAIAARKNGVAVYHMEAGNRCSTGGSSITSPTSTSAILNMQGGTCWLKAWSIDGS